MKYLPLYPILARYPFLKVASSVFSFNIEEELGKFPDTLETAKRVVEKAIDGKMSMTDSATSPSFSALVVKRTAIIAGERGRLRAVICA